MIGRVVSTKSKNTAVVLVARNAVHPLYKKVFLRSKKYLADDQLGVKDGDIVKIEKCKPISKRKHWKITKVLGANLAEIVEAEQKIKAEQEIAQVMPEEKEVDRVKGIGSSEETVENREIEKKTKKLRKEKLVPKP